MPTVALVKPANNGTDQRLLGRGLQPQLCHGKIHGDT
jgi:hypothetical protein